MLNSSANFHKISPRHQITDGANVVDNVDLYSGNEQRSWRRQPEETEPLLLVQPECARVENNGDDGDGEEEICCRTTDNNTTTQTRRELTKMIGTGKNTKKRLALASKLSLASFSSKRRPKKEKPEFQSASFSEMLRYADRWDYFLLAVGILTNIASGALNPASSLIFRGITDVLMDGQHQLENGTLDMEQFSSGMVYHVWLYVVLGIITFINVKLCMATFSTVCERQVYRIRRRLFKAILAQEPGWFDRPANQVGALTHKMASGIDRIKEGMSDKIGLILQALSSCIAGVAYGFWMSWRMTLVMLVTTPFLVICFVGSAATISRLVRKEMSAYSAAGAVAEEVLSGIRTVAAFNAQYFELNRYKKHLDTGRKTGIRKGLWVAFFAGLHMIIMFGSMGIVFWYGTSLVLEGTITPGTVFAVFWSVVIGAMTLGRALPQLGVIIGAKLAAGEMFAIIDRKPALDATSTAGMRPERVQGRIEFTEVQFAYPTRPTQKVLKGVSFCVEPGQSIALVGHSGCGKSTLVGLMMRFYEAQRGSVTLDGIPLRDLNVHWLRQNIALVQQEPVLFADTVEGNLRMGKADVTTEEMVAACRMANAHDFICKLPEGYKTRVGQGGIQLSGGQKQRLAIARSLVRNPRILLLDEATSALDAESEQIVQEALERASSGRTTVTIAHRLSTVRNADRILVFEHGKIVEDGNHVQLMAKPDSLYRQLVLAQQIANSQQPDVAVEDASDDEGGMAAAASRAQLARADQQRTSETKMMRASERMRRSMTSVKSAGLRSVEGDDELEELDEELHEMDARPASLWDIMQYARPERLIIILGVLLALCRGISWPLFSVIYGRLFLILSSALGSDPSSFTAAERDEQAQHLFAMNILNSLAFVGLGIFGALTTFGSGSLLCVVGERLTQRLRLDVFKNILSQDGYFFDDQRHSPGKLSQRLATDAPNVQAAIDQRLAEVLQGGVSLVAGITVAFSFGWNVAPIGLGTALILVVFQTSVSNYLKRRGMRDMLLAEDASRVATESIEYVRTVQALNRQEAAYEMFRDSSAKPHRMAINRGLWTSLSFAITGSFVPFNFGLTYYLGLLLIRGGFTTPFILFQVVEALNMASFTIMAAAAYFPEYLRAKLSAGLMFTMARLRPRIDSLSDAGLVTPIQGQIEAASIYFAYPNSQKHLALNGLTLGAPSGKTVALVGPSGCGKSTLVQLLERNYDPISGCISVDGLDIRRYNLRHLRKSMALVGQEPTLFALSIRENIAYGLAEDEMTEQGIQAAAKLANIHAFIESLPQKYETPVGPRGTQLSGGQKQRIAIARAIVRDPRILLLDEATSALDTESEKVVQEALDRAKQGRTSLVIAHRLSTVQNADLIVVIRDGRVAELGNHQQLIQRKGLYYRLVQRQQGGGGGGDNGEGNGEN